MFLYALVQTRNTCIFSNSIESEHNKKVLDCVAWDMPSSSTGMEYDKADIKSKKPMPTFLSHTRTCYYLGEMH